MILAGDIGATKTVLALFEEKNNSVVQMDTATFASKEYPSLESVLTEFLHQVGAVAPEAACFGVAGPVIDGCSRTTNLPWVLEESVLAQACGARRVKLLNDLEAMAYGMVFLRPEELSVLQAGTQPKGKGNVAVIAAGSGLGEGFLYWDGARYHPIASEGGHADFAPRTEQEIALLRYLQTKLGDHVSYERVLSGPGVYAVYGFLRDSGYAAEPAWLAEQLQSGDPSATITQLGLAGTEPLCAATLALFCSIYGAEAGNLALKCLALGGVFIGGGIAPKILPALQQGGFMRAFLDKGRFAELLGSMTVCVALNPQAPLWGAAQFALRL